METNLKPNFKNLEKKNISDENKKNESPFDKFDREIIKLFGNSKLVEYRWPILFSAAIVVLFLFVKIFLSESIVVKAQPPSVIVQVAAPVPVPAVNVPTVNVPAAAAPAPNTIYAPVMPIANEVSSVKVPSTNAIPLDLTKVTEPMSPIKITDYKKVGGFENFFDNMETSLFTEFDTEA